MPEDESAAEPGDCSYCGARRPDVRRMATLPDGRGVDICDHCLALALRRFGGTRGAPRAGEVCTDPHRRVCTAAERPG